METAIKTVDLANLALAFIPVMGGLADLLSLVTQLWQRDLCRCPDAGAITDDRLLPCLPALHRASFGSTGGVATDDCSVSWIALNTVLEYRRVLLLKACLAIALGGGVTLLVISQAVLQVEPWYAPQYMIPLGGMIFANAMTSVSLAAERFHSEIQHGDNFQQARAIAFNASLIPVVNSLFAVGLVSLPGMMTGQILSGVSPLIAARYQIMVMCMIFAASGISSALFLFF